VFKGTGTALITPFNERLEVDYPSLKKLVGFQLENKVDALILLGTTGEAPTIEVEERKKIISEVVQHVNGKIPVIIGTGTNDTKKVVMLNKIAEDYKADGLLIVNPYYNKGTQASIYEHFKYISERTSLPIILYNVPSRTASNILPDTILKIHADCKNVTAVKEASGDISQIAELISKKPASLSILSGNDDQILPIMALGGDGVISVFSNIFPRETVSITDACLENNFVEARAIHNKYLQMMNTLFIETNPMPVKYAASLLGLCENTLRLPLTKITSSSENKIKEEMNKYNKKV
jgi:4-hydroxy-tetrahydrodipicolinate synthase